MGDNTTISWCDATWGITRGCSRVSAGCGDGTGGGCYAERMAHRFSGPGKPFEGLTRLTSRGPRWTGVARFIPDMLDLPLRWKRPRKIFVSSMSDLFHDDITNQEIAAVFGVMAAAPRHTFQILTKRPERMLEWFRWVAGDDHVPPVHVCETEAANRIDCDQLAPTWPLPNVWLGTSTENQETANARIPLLLGTPAAVRFVSAEPLLGPIDLRRVAWGNGDFCNALQRNSYRGGLDSERLDLVIAGGESGPGARPCAMEWIEALVDQCAAAGSACWVKQLGAVPVSTERVDDQGKWAWSAGLRDRKGEDMSEWPAHLRVRQMPDVKGTVDDGRG